MRTWLQKTVLALVLIAGLAPAIAQAPPPVPGLPDAERRTAYTIAATNCACAVNMALYGDSTDYQNWIEVWLNGVQVQYNDPVFAWTITSPTGPLSTIPRPITDGVLTFANAQTGTVQIVGARRPRRVSQFSENQGVSARNLNQVITDIVAMLREVWDKINDVTGRILVAPPGETMTPLPQKANRAGLQLGFDANGNPIVLTSTGANTFGAGNGINFTGTGPTIIKNNISAGTGIAITGTNPLVISTTAGGAASFGAIGYAPSSGSCASGAGAGPDDTAALTTAANQPMPVALQQNRCYKITSTIVMTTSGGGLTGDRTSTIWMPAASFNSSTLCSTLNCLTSNAVGFYIQGQLSTPFTAIDRAALSGFRILSEVSDGRAVGPIAIRNATNSFLTNLELSGFPVGAGIYADTLTNVYITGNYIHSFTTNAVWGSGPQIMGLAVDGSRVNGLGSRYLHIQNNNLQDIFFGTVTTGTWTQQTVGLGIFTVGGVGEDIITGNTIQNTGECIDNYSTRSVIANNMVLACAQGALNIKHGGSYNVMAHNVIYASGLYGITISGDTTKVTTENLIDSNVIIELDPNAVGPPISACIRFNDNGTAFHSTANVIQNNYCDAVGGKYGLFGDSSDGAGNSYNNNTIIGASTANINVAASTAQPSGGYVVAQLPSCTVGTKGLKLYVTDQAGSPTFLGALTGSGSITAPVICNGTAWEAG